MSRTPAPAVMVIKTDELPAAAPADSSRDPNSQAGGKGRPGAAGEQGRGQRGAGRGGRTGPSGQLGSRFCGDRRLPSAPGWGASLRALHRAAPALKVTFTVAPGYGQGFARGVQRRATAAGTRAPDRGDTCAHTLFRGAPPLPPDSAAPPPLLRAVGSPPGSGH